MADLPKFSSPGKGSSGKGFKDPNKLEILPKGHKMKPGSILVPHVRLAKLGYNRKKRA